MDPQQVQKKLASSVGTNVQNFLIRNEISPLVSLPKEIWAHIFNNVPQKDKLVHRVVSKEWCKNLDEFSTVDVVFNAQFPLVQHHERVFDLRIRGCTFSSLQVPFFPNFKNPLLIKEITFTTQVSASNVLRVLSVCSNIETLRFLTTMTSETAFDENSNSSISNVLNNLKNLHYLEIGVLTFLDRNPGQKSKTFSALIGNDHVLLPALKVLNVAFIVRHIEWFQLFKFISRHSVTLKSLNAICPCGERLVGNEQRAKEIVIPQNLVLPQLDTLIVNGASDCPCREDVWLLLDQQKHLRRYETDISRGAVFLKDIVERNHETIRVLKLHQIGNLYSDELNCDIFKKCLSLQDLSLRFDWGFVIVVNVGGGTAQSRTPVMYNLEALPKNLKRLTLCGSQILSSELESLFSSEKGLEEVTLGRAESLKVKNSGMTARLLVTMLENLVQLKKFRIFLDMICELEAKEMYYCGDLNGIWLKVWEIATEMGIIDTDNPEEQCCGEKYSEEGCRNHRPFIDMVFRTRPDAVMFSERIKEL